LERQFLLGLVDRRAAEFVTRGHQAYRSVAEPA
jgi:hypothetical protein